MDEIRAATRRSSFHTGLEKPRGPHHCARCFRFRSCREDKFARRVEDSRQVHFGFGNGFVFVAVMRRSRLPVSEVLRGPSNALFQPPS